MGNVIFNVSGCSEGNCVMRTNSANANNNGNATVDVNDTVTWNRTGNSVSSFSITVNQGSDQDIWGDTPPAPFPNSDSPNWQGTVKNYGDGGENYTISCTCGSSNQSHDPRISVNPNK